MQEGAEEDDKTGEYHSYSEYPSLGLKFETNTLKDFLFY